MILPMLIYNSSVHQSILLFENILFALTYYPSEQFKVWRYFILYQDKNREIYKELLRLTVYPVCFGDGKQVIEYNFSF